MVARHIGKGASYLFAAGTAVVIAGLGAGVALLGFGPLSLDFVADDMAAALARQMPGYQVAIGGAKLDWDGERRGLAVRLTDVRFADADGDTALAVPDMAVALDRRALLTGDLRPTRVAVDGASIAVTRRADGALAWHSGQSGDGGWQALLDEMIAGGAGLDGIDIRHATVTLADAQTGGRTQVRQADLSLVREADGVHARLSGLVGLNGRDSPVEIDTLYRPTAAFTVALRFQDLRPGDAAIGLAVDALADYVGIDVPLTGELHLTVGADGVPERLRYDLAAGAGVIEMAPLPAPATLTRARASGSADLRTGKVDIVSLSAELDDGVVLDAQGEVNVAEAGIGAGLVAHMRGLTTAALANYWPETMAVGARRWVTGNLSSGEITDAKLVVQAEPGELQAVPPRPDLVRLEFAFEGVDVRYWQPLPRLTDARGRATLDLDNFDLRLERGRVGKLTVADGKVHIGHLSTTNRHTAEIEFVAQGSATEALALLDRKPLRFASQLDLDPAAVGGGANVWAGFTVPLRSELALDDIGYQASAVLDRFSVPALFGRYPLSGGELSLSVDKTGISAEGTATIAALPVNLSWRRDFGVTSTDGSPVYPDRYGIAGTADVADFKSVGLDLTMLGQGPVNTLFNLWISDEGQMVATGEADLTATDLTGLILRWRKPPQTPANVKFRLETDTAGLLRLRDLVFQSGDDLVRADADFGAGARHAKLYLPTLRLGGHDLAATVTWPEAGGPIEVDVGGRMLDARPFLADAGSDEGPPGTLAARLRLSVAQLRLADETMLTAADGRLSIEQGALEHVRLNGRLNGAAPVLITVGTGSDHRDVVLTSANAGEVLGALDVFEDAEGGSLKIRGRVPRGPGPITGHFSAAGVQVRKAPLLAQILSLGSISGIQDVLSGDGLVLREVDLPFVLTEPELTVDDGRAIGPDIGLTVAGRYDRQADTMDFSGVLVPTYTLNRLLGEIPVIGDILIGRKGEGLFAVNYQVAGPADEPEVSVNPLSALAPGIFRRLVEGLLPAGAAAGGGTEPAPERERPAGR
jgi:hypothetical protein